MFIVTDTDTLALWSHQDSCLFAKIIKGADVVSLIDQLKNVMEKYDREKPFEFRFMDEAFAEQYKAEDRLSKILSTFTAFALLIASLGLFGLAIFMTVQRTKEICVRKVLGLLFITLSYCYQRILYNW